MTATIPDVLLPSEDNPPSTEIASTTPSPSSMETTTEMPLLDET